jgi:hypothetical protein
MRGRRQQRAHDDARLSCDATCEQRYDAGEGCPIRYLGRISDQGVIWRRSLFLMWLVASVIWVLFILSKIDFLCLAGPPTHWCRYGTAWSFSDLLDVISTLFGVPAMVFGIGSLFGWTFDRLRK